VTNGKVLVAGGTLENVGKGSCLPRDDLPDLKGNLFLGSMFVEEILKVKYPLFIYIMLNCFSDISNTLP